MQGKNAGARKMQSKNARAATTKVNAPSKDCFPQHFEHFPLFLSVFGGCPCIFALHFRGCFERLISIFQGCFQFFIARNAVAKMDGQKKMQGQKKAFQKCKGRKKQSKNARAKMQRQKKAEQKCRAKIQGQTCRRKKSRTKMQRQKVQS